jgi:hypothetical protein
MNASTHSDPAEQGLLRLCYRNWRPTRLGRWANRLWCWWSGLGMPPRFQAALEVRGRTSGRIHSNPVVIAKVEDREYLVSMLGPGSDWVKNVEAAYGDAVIRQGRRRRVHLVSVPREESTYGSRRAGESTSRFLPAHRCPTSRPSASDIPCTGSIPVKDDVRKQLRMTRRGYEVQAVERKIAEPSRSLEPLCGGWRVL